MTDISKLRRLVGGIPTTIDLSASGNVLQAYDMQLMNVAISASLPLKLDSNKKFISGAIVLTSGSGEVTGQLSDSNLATITTSNKVSGSAVQLNSTGGLQDSSGLAFKLDGLTLTTSASGARVNEGQIDTLQLANGAVKTGNITIDGNLNMQNYKVVSVADPGDDATAAANKAYVDNLISGMKWQPPAEALQMVSNSSQAGIPPVAPAQGDGWVADNWGGGYTNGDIYYYDGAAWQNQNTLASGMYFVVASASASGSFSGKENNIAKYVGSGTYTFVAPADGNAILVHEGYYANQAFIYETATSQWNQFSGAGQINAGVGLAKDGNTLNVLLGAGIKELPTHEVGIDLATNSGLELTTNSADGQLQVASSIAGSGLAFGSGIISVGAGDGISVASDSVSLASTTAGDGLTYGSGILAVGAGDGISVASDSVSLASSTAGDGLTFSSGVLAVGAGDGISVASNSIAVQAANNTISVGSAGIKIGTATDGAAGQFLKTDGSGGVAWGNSAGSMALEDLTDVVITLGSRAANDFLMYNGSEWINQQIAGNGISVTSGVVSLASSTAGDGLTFASGVLAVGAGDGLSVASDSISLASSTAGSGLTFSSGVLNVGAGNGISVASDSVSLASSAAGAGLSYSSGVISIAAAAAGDGLSLTSGVLAVNVDNSSIEINSDALRVKALGVQDAMLYSGVASGYSTGVASSYIWAPPLTDYNSVFNAGSGYLKAQFTTASGRDSYSPSLKSALSVSSGDVKVTDNANAIWKLVLNGSVNTAVSDLNEVVGGTAEISKFDFDSKTPADFSGGEYAYLSSTASNYYVWFKKDGAGTDPAPGGKTSLGFVNVVTGDTTSQICDKFVTVVNGATFGAVKTNIASGLSGTYVAAAINLSSGYVLSSSHNLEWYISGWSNLATLNGYFNSDKYISFWVKQADTTSLYTLKRKSTNTNLFTYGSNVLYADSQSAKTNFYINGAGCADGTNPNFAMNFTDSSGVIWNAANPNGFLITDTLPFPWGTVYSGPNYATELDGTVFDLISMYDKTLKLATNFTPTSSGTLSKVSLSAVKIGIPANTSFTVSIYSDTGSNAPNVSLADSVARSDVSAYTSTGNTWLDWTFSSPVSYTSGTKYWMVISANDLGGSNLDGTGNNGLRWAKNKSRTAATGNTMTKLGAGAWANSGTTEIAHGLYSPFGSAGSYVTVTNQSVGSVTDATASSPLVATVTTQGVDGTPYYSVKIDNAALTLTKSTDGGLNYGSVANFSTFSSLDGSGVYATKNPSGLVAETGPGGPSSSSNKLVKTTSGGKIAPSLIDAAGLAGIGLQASGDTLAIKLDTNSGLTTSASGLKVAATIAGNGLSLTSGVLAVTGINGISVTSSGVSLASATAGNGLTYTSGVLDVGAGVGIAVAADSVSLASTTAGAGLTYTSGVLSIATSAAGAGLTLTSGVLNVGSGNGISVASDSISLASTTAGDGLTYTSGILAVGVGEGLTVASDSISLSSTVAGDGLSYSSGVMAINAGTALSLTSDTLNVDAGPGISVASDRVEIDPNLAGDGLTYSSGIMAVGAGNGLTVASDSIAVQAADNTISVTSSGIKIGTPTDGSNLQFLQTDGSGNVSWATVDLASVTLQAAYDNSTPDIDGYAAITETSMGVRLVGSADPENILLISAPSDCGSYGLKIDMKNGYTGLLVYGDGNGAASFINSGNGTAVYIEGASSGNPAAQVTNTGESYALSVQQTSSAVSAIRVQTGGTALSLTNAAGTYSAEIAVPASLADYKLTIPSAAPSDGKALKTNASGILSWGAFVSNEVGSDETVYGIKTFASFPVTPSIAPASNYQVANKKYVDDTVVAATPEKFQYKDQTAGESFAANSTFVVRWALNGETAGRVYKATKDQESSPDKYWGIGVLQTTASLSAGDLCTVVKKGKLNLQSGDTNFGASDNGKPIFLSTDGTFGTATPETGVTSGDLYVSFIVGHVVSRSGTTTSSVFEVDCNPGGLMGIDIA